MKSHFIKAKNIFTLLILFFLLSVQTGFGAEFLDWEKSGEVLKRFGEGSGLKNAREWTQWAQERLMAGRYLSKGFSTEEKIHQAAFLDWEKAQKEETKSYSMVKFPLDQWHGYEFISLSYTNLDFKEQAFGIHFELSPSTLKLDEIIKRYGHQQLEILDQGGKKTYRYTVVPGDSLRETPWKFLQSQMIENDELWVEFELRDQDDVRSVEVLTVKASPSKIPFTKNWKWDD